MEALDRFMVRRNHKNPVWAEIIQRPIQTLRMPQRWSRGVVDSGNEWVTGVCVIWEACTQFRLMETALLIPHLCYNGRALSGNGTLFNRQAIPFRYAEGSPPRLAPCQCKSDTIVRRGACTNPLGCLRASLGEALGHLGLSKW
ncbi:hypothetical protein RF11_00673 [Thelohanellus kitauei]|uniref:Uncharacterized protein n=1 Tax=Thelohanellus kitauei TaxID=669202 RepID=A0A0C2N9H9_THEKT|nr:hypothetical protein RF11_00673 [Thelohanellus kitauei]